MEARYPSCIPGTCCLPWTPGFSLDKGLFRGAIRYLALRTPHIYVMGTAGEGYGVSGRQFREVVRVSADEMGKADGAPMVGVISLSLPEILDRIETARGLGVREFQVSLPSWGPCCGPSGSSPPRCAISSRRAGVERDLPVFTAMQAELVSLSRDLVALVGACAHMDGAYDRMYLKLVFPDFPLRLLPPSGTCRQPGTRAGFPPRESDRHERSIILPPRGNVVHSLYSGGAFMKRWFTAFLAVVAAAGAFAAPHGNGVSELRDEIKAFLEAKASVPVNSLTVGDLEGMAGKISVVLQKNAYVAKAGVASFMMPGMGQFLTGNPVGGALFLTGDLAVAAGAMVGAYFLLPAKLQWGSGNGTGATGLDYLNTPKTQIHDAWKSGTVMDYLPSMGVMAAGMAVNRLLGLWASRDAVEAARRNVADGKVTFQPEILPMLGSGGMGMGMRMRY